MANFTAISGSNITDIKGTKLASGVISFLGTDNMDQPISFQIGGGGQALRTSITSPVVAGVITGFNVPDPGSTQPSGIFYRVTVIDSSTGLEVLRYRLVSFTGATFNFDSYVSPNAVAGASLSGNSVTGNLSVTGNVAATGTVTGSNIAGGVINTGAGTTNKLPKYTNGPSGVVGDSSITDNGTTVSTSEAVSLGSTLAVTGQFTESDSIKLAEIAAPAGAAAFDVLYADSTAHRLKVKNNNGAAVQLVQTGGDISASDQVTVTHLASPLPTAQGGTAVNSSATFPASGVVATTSNTLGDFAATTSAQLRGVVSDETGTGALVFGTGPTIATPSISSPTTTGTDNGAQTLQNKTLQGAGSGNAVTLLNAQGPASAIVGNSADQTVFTFTIPANTIQAGKGFKVEFGLAHTTGSASVTYKLILGTTTLGGSWADAGSALISGYGNVMNVAGVQNSQYCIVFGVDGPTIVQNQTSAPAENLANALAIKLTFNVAATDQVTPKFWKVTLEQ